ncbi:MAG: carboxypeptidase-like regulatory domain-containing protein [Planctomycetota bacterium]
MRFKSIHSGVSVVLSMALLVGSPLLASETVAIRSSDYLLGQESILAGSVVNQSGMPVAGLPVQVLHKGQVIATALSDDKGEFAVQGLRNGQHTVKVGASQQSVRFWMSKAAPPTAVSRLAIVVDEEVVRGQCGEGCGEGFSGADHRAWKTAVGVLLIGGAVATTLALTLDDNNSSAVPGSP